MLVLWPNDQFRSGKRALEVQIMWAKWCQTSGRTWNKKAPESTHACWSSKSHFCWWRDQRMNRVCAAIQAERAFCRCTLWSSLPGLLPRTTAETLPSGKSHLRKPTQSAGKRADEEPHSRGFSARRRSITPRASSLRRSKGGVSSLSSFVVATNLLLCAPC